MQESIASLKKTAQTAGLFYLLMGVTGLFALIYVPMNIVVKDNPAATFHNIQSQQLLFRLGIVANLASSVLSVWMALAFYRLFKKSNEGLAKLLMVFVFVQIPIVFVAESLNVTSLLIAKGDLMHTVSDAVRQDLTVSFFRTYLYGMHIMGIFMGLWLIPLGELFYRSAYMSKVIGVLLVFSGLALIADSVAYLIFPGARGTTRIVAYLISGVAEISAILWLMIRGVKQHIYVAVVSEQVNESPLTTNMQAGTGIRSAH